MKHRLLLPALVFLIQTSSFAQDISAIEKKLNNEFGRISYWVNLDNGDLSKYDSLEKANEVFEKSLLNCTAKYPATLKHPFKQLDSSGLSIASASDGQFRIYSWDTYTGGTMHVFSTVYQYASGNKTFSMKEAGEEGDPGSWYNAVYTLQAGKITYYLAVYHNVFSTRDRNIGIKIFSLVNGKLDPKAKLIKTGSGMNNTLNVEFDVPALQSEDYPEIHYDAATKTILIPLLSAEGKLTGKNISYRFNGTCFEKLKK